MSPRPPTPPKLKPKGRTGLLSAGPRRSCAAGIIPAEVEINTTCRGNATDRSRSAWEYVVQHVLHEPSAEPPGPADISFPAVHMAHCRTARPVSNRFVSLHLPEQPLSCGSRRSSPPPARVGPSVCAGSKSSGHCCCIVVQLRLKPTSAAGR